MKTKLLIQILLLTFFNSLSSSYAKGKIDYCKCETIETGKEKGNTYLYLTLNRNKGKTQEAKKYRAMSFSVNKSYVDIYQGEMLGTPEACKIVKATIADCN